MERNQRPATFHFFGDVVLEDPALFLREGDFEVVQRYLPLIRTMDLEWRHRPPSDWNIDHRFEEFVRQETEAWRQLGVERSQPSEFLLTPSGSINAPLAHHLLNPTFFVANPYSHNTDDPSNPTISLLHENGFSSGEECFFFDQICRRSRTDHCLRFWTMDIQKPHDDFVRDIRHNMSAIVEIIWGENAWMKMKQQCDLIRFPLWGKLKDVRLYLEIESKKPKRFIFWVHHPQFFFRPRRQKTTGGIPDRVIQARVQDLALDFACRLVGLPIKQNFYENHPRGKYPRLKPDQLRVCEALENSSLIELKEAFPLKASQREHHPVKGKTQNDPIGRRMEYEQLQIILKELENQQTFLQDPRKGLSDEDFLSLWRERRNQIYHLMRSWLDVCQTLEGNNLALDDSILNESSWFLLAHELIDWIQDQDGLKIDGKAMESREEIEKAFWLLRCDETKLQTGCIQTSPIDEIAMQVGFKYTNYACLNKRKPIILDGAIPLPQIISRECGTCKGRVLDDAFPYFAKAKQNVYLVRCHQFKGCGLPGCEGSVVLLPSDKWQDSMKPSKENLENPHEHPNGRAEWTSFFCRSKDELGKLPKTVQTRCKSCGAPRLERRARWTIERDPRFVIPILKCQEGSCNGCNQAFLPVESFKTINSSALSRYWTEATSEGFDPSDNTSLRDNFLDKLNLSSMRDALKTAGQNCVRAQSLNKKRKRSSLA